MSNAVDAVVEIFTWVGIGLGALLAGVALIAYLADGTWVRVRAVVEHMADRTVVRWFDADGNVNEATLSPAEEHHLAGKDMADIWAREGRIGRMRLHRRSPVVRAFTTLAAVLLGVGAVSLVASLALLFVRG
jgi:hypothetical protein